MRISKASCSVLGCGFAIANLLAGPDQLFAETTNQFSLQHLAGLYLPDCQLRLDDAKNPKAIVSSAGEVLELGPAAQETPAPDKEAGYWFSPTMNFLSRQKIKAATPQQAIGTVQLLHAIWSGPDFVKKKIYKARRIDFGWLVEVEHDFTNYPGMVLGILPYELCLGKDDRVVQFRERCYFYLGRTRIYTNTLISVYESEIKRDGGCHFPDSLFKELQKAWAREKEQIPGGARQDGGHP